MLLLPAAGPGAAAAAAPATACLRRSLAAAAPATMRSASDVRTPARTGPPARHVADLLMPTIIPVGSGSVVPPVHGACATAYPT